MSPVLDRLAFWRRSTSEQSEIPALMRFDEAFEWASERRLHVLYDEVADMLDREFAHLRKAGEAQLDVLRTIALETGLPDRELEEPLDEEAEAFARHADWRASAQWAVLGLLWRLGELAPVSRLSSDEWARSAGERSWEVLGSSGLPRPDEPVALAFAAGQLQRGLASSENASALLVSDRPLLIDAPGEASVTASPIRPIALVAGRPDRLGPEELALSEGDKLWPAGALAGSPLEMFGAEQAVRVDIGGSQTVEVADPYVLAPVVNGVVLLFERQPGEDPLG